MWTRHFFSALAVTVCASVATAGELGVYQSGPDGFDTKTFWYDDGEEITIIDTQFVPALTQAMVDEIRKGSDNPITRVIVTHPNPDKFNGLSVLHELGARSVASKATAEAMKGVHDYKKFFWVEIAQAFTNDTYPVFEDIDETFDGDKTITLKSGETISLIELKNSGVTTTQTVVRIDETGDLIVGDLVHYKSHAWLEGGIKDGAPRPDIDAWIAAVEELKTLGGSKIHGGRGPSGSVDAVVADQVEYLQKMDALVSDYVESLGNKSGELTDPNTAGAHFEALQAKAEKAFPERGLSYLVGYGVYGLAQSKL
ncbi:MAG: MBL fold metallo-hydrolase [Pseudomonadota bacterium]